MYPTVNSRFLWLSLLFLLLTCRRWFSFFESLALETVISMDQPNKRKENGGRSSWERLVEHEFSNLIRSTRTAEAPNPLMSRPLKVRRTAGIHQLPFSRARSEKADSHSGNPEEQGIVDCVERGKEEKEAFQLVIFFWVKPNCTIFKKKKRFLGHLSCNCLHWRNVFNFESPENPAMIANVVRNNLKIGTIKLNTRNAKSESPKSSFYFKKMKSNVICDKVAIIKDPLWRCGDLILPGLDPFSCTFFMQVAWSRKGIKPTLWAWRRSVWCWCGFN